MLPITIQANPHLKSCASRIVPLKLVGLITILLSSVSIVQPAFFNSFTCEKRPTYILSVIQQLIFVVNQLEKKDIYLLLHQLH